MSTETTNCEQPDPVSADDDVYFDFAQAGYEAASSAITATIANDFESERPLFDAMATGLNPFLRWLTLAEQHAVAGFIAGAANAVRDALNPLSKSNLTNQEKSNEPE